MKTSLLKVLYIALAGFLLGGSLTATANCSDVTQIKCSYEGSDATPIVNGLFGSTWTGTSHTEPSWSCLLNKSVCDACWKRAKNPENPKEKIKKAKKVKWVYPWSPILTRIGIYPRLCS